jgi:hypothetical protein
MGDGGGALGFEWWKTQCD